MFKLQSPSKYSPFDVIHLWRHFFQKLLKSVLNWLTLMPFSASFVFCFTSSTTVKHFPLRTFFIWGNKQKKVAQGERGGWGTRVMPFLIKNCWTLSASWAGVIIKSPIMKWAKESSKKIHWSWTQPLPTMAAGNTDIGGFLEHSPSGGSLYKRPTLQKIIPFWGGPPCKSKPCGHIRRDTIK